MKFLKIKAVIEKTGLSRASIYRLMKDERFPKSIPLGDRAVAWLESEVNQWMRDRLDERDV